MSWRHPTVSGSRIELGWGSSEQRWVAELRSGGKGAIRRWLGRSRLGVTSGCWGDKW